jgi:hypothetical protein
MKRFQAQIPMNLESFNLVLRGSVRLFHGVVTLVGVGDREGRVYEVLPPTGSWTSNG